MYGITVRSFCQAGQCLNLVAFLAKTAWRLVAVDALDPFFRAFLA